MSPLPHDRDRVRQGVRALLVHEGAVLLARSHDRFDVTRSWWELPGGGIEVGESIEEALRRELLEETGYTDVEIGRQLCEWTTQWVFSDREVDQHDIVHVVRLRSSSRIAPEPLATEGLEEVVWVPIALLGSLRAPVVPVRVGALVEAAANPTGESFELEIPARVPWPMVNGAQVLVRLWAHTGAASALRAAQDQLLSLAHGHRGDVVARLRPLALDGAAGGDGLPDEVHLLRFPGPLELNAYLVDPRRDAVDTSSISRIEVVPVGSVPTTDPSPDPNGAN